MTPEQYKITASKWTTKQIEKELASWRKHMEKHSQAYAFHGNVYNPPGVIPDGDKVAILREILEDRKLENHRAEEIRKWNQYRPTERCGVGDVC